MGRCRRQAAGASRPAHTDVFQHIEAGGTCLTGLAERAHLEQRAISNGVLTRPTGAPPSSH
jgi:hypothetical protein